MWKQARTVNISQMGKRSGYCLVNTRVGGVPDIPSKYQTAHEAQLHTTLHPGTPPSGVWVPVFFDFYATIDGVYKNWGHVGWYKDGVFYSDGVRYASIAAYEAHHAPRYRGWGETLNGVRIIEWVADPVPAPSVPASGTLHLDKGTITSTFDHNGNKVGSIYARDDTYDYVIRGHNGNRVIVNSASGGGNGVEIALTYLAGGVIPGRHIK